jgi:hypothetical protein
MFQRTGQQRVCEVADHLLVTECDSTIGESLLETVDIGPGRIEPDDCHPVSEAGCGVFDAFDSDEDVMHSQRAGFAV